MKLIITFLSLTFFLTSCVLTSQLPTVGTKERFMELAFWGTGPQRTPYRIENDYIFYAKSATISVIGNAAPSHKAELNTVLNILRPYFDLKIHYGYLPKADIYLNIISSEASSYEISLVERENIRNKVIFDRLGGHMYAEPGLLWPKYTLSRVYRPYALDKSNANFVLPATGTAFPFYNSLEKQQQTFWKILLPIVEVTHITEQPDFGFTDVFVGLTRKDLENDENSAKNLNPIVEAVIFEELVHALAGWTDVSDPRRIMFSGAYDSRPKKHNGKNEYQTMYQKYQAELPELKQMLSYYKLPGMKPGLSYEEVKAIINP